MHLRRIGAQSASHSFRLSLFPSHPVTPSPALCNLESCMTAPSSNRRTRKP